MSIAPPSASAVRALAPSLPLLTGLIVYAAMLLTGGMMLHDPDPYWHIATGRWILLHHAVPHEDVFSYTVLGAPWLVHAWLAEVGMAVIYDHLGWSGLIVSASLAAALSVSLLLRALLRYLEPAYAVIGAVTFWGLMMPHAFARPHLFAMPILVAWVALLVRARAEERAPSPWAALLMVAWANLHGGFLLGEALVALFAGEMALEQPDWPSLRRQAPGWVLFVALSVAAGCLTPNGLAAMLVPLHFLNMQTHMATVTEWETPNFQTPQALEFWLLLALLGVLISGIRVSVTRAAMVLLMLHLALIHQRFAEVLGLSVPLLVAPSLAPQLPPVTASGFGAWVMRLPPRAGPGGISLMGGVAALLAALVAGRGISNDFGPYTPAAAVSFVKAQQISGPVLNSYDFGGYLIFVGIPPYIDGRAQLYGDAFIKRDQNLASLPSVLAQYHITWTLLQTGDPRIALLDHLPGWRRFYADNDAVVHVRDLAGSTSDLGLDRGSAVVKPLL